LGNDQAVEWISVMQREFCVRQQMAELNIEHFNLNRLDKTL